MQRSVQTGFTLVEIVVGIVLTAFGLTLITTVFFSSPGRSVEPVLQIRAAEFGQALMDEILAKPFDENTPLGGVPACVAGGCTAEAGFGSDAGETRDSFDDVDDYHSYCGAGVALEDASGNPPSGGQFSNYLMSVCVTYDGDYNGTTDTNTNAKLITVSISPPTGAGLGNPIVITAYRGNF